MPRSQLFRLVCVVMIHWSATSLLLAFEPASDPVVRCQERVAPASDGRMVFVRVVDSDGSPVSGASIKLGYRILDDSLDQAFETDDGGTTVVNFPKAAQSLTVGVHKSGFIPKIYFWGMPADQDVPDELSCKIARGTTIGGLVKNSRGEPIAGARVELNINSDSTKIYVDSTSSTNFFFVSEKDAPVTNAAGHWSYDGVPADGRIRVSVSHPDYAGDSRHSFSAEQQSFTQNELREQSAVSVLPDGIRIEGVVLSDRGQPISKPFIALQQSPSLSLDATGDERGRFRLAVVKGGKFDLAVVAQGYAPEYVKFDTRSDRLPLSVRLKPGNTVRFRVVDSENQPLKAWVRVKKCLGVDVFSNIKSAIPTRTNDDGVFEWDWAPTGELTFAVGAPGFVTSDADLSTTEKAAERVVELQREGIVSGRVIDRRTREPLDRYLVIPFGYMGNPMRQLGVVGRNGSFAIPLGRFEDASIHLMIEHAGHKTVLTDESFSKSKPAKDVLIEMDTADPISGRVIDADGKAVADAIISISESSSGLIETRSMRLGQTSTDEAGKFSFPAPPGDFSILATGNAGFVKKTFDAKRPEGGDLQLREWGIVVGQVLDSNGQPSANCGVHIMPEGKGVRNLSPSTTADRDGRFKFGRVPSEDCELWVFSPPDAEGKSERLATKKIDVPPGEQITVDIKLD